MCAQRLWLRLIASASSRRRSSEERMSLRLGRTMIDEISDDGKRSHRSGSQKFFPRLRSVFSLLFGEYRPHMEVMGFFT